MVQETPWAPPNEEARHFNAEVVDRGADSESKRRRFYECFVDDDMWMTNGMHELLSWCTPPFEMSSAYLLDQVSLQRGCVQGHTIWMTGIPRLARKSPRVDELSFRSEIRRSRSPLDNRACGAAVQVKTSSE